MTADDRSQHRLAWSPHMRDLLLDHAIGTVSTQMVRSRSVQRAAARRTVAVGAITWLRSWPGKDVAVLRQHGLAQRSGEAARVVPDGPFLPTQLE
jgi:hypothetical protein